MVVKQKQISRTSWSINKTKMRDNYLEPKIKRKMIARKKNYFEVNKTTSGSSKKRKTARKAKQPKLETKNHGHMEPIFVWKSQSLRVAGGPPCRPRTPPGKRVRTFAPKTEILERDIHGHRGSDM